MPGPEYRDVKVPPPEETIRLPSQTVGLGPRHASKNGDSEKRPDPAPTIDPGLPLDQEEVDRFWKVGPEFNAVEIHIELSETPLELLEKLGPAPFPRGTFPVIGFLATTYERVSRFALERAPRSSADGR